MFYSIDNAGNEQDTQVSEIIGVIATPHFTITAIDLETEESVLNFATTINGTYYSTSEGEIVTDLLITNPSLWNFTISSSTHYSRSYTDYNISESGDLQTIMFIKQEGVEPIAQSIKIKIDGTFIPISGISIIERWESIL